MPLSWTRAPKLKLAGHDNRNNGTKVINENTYWPKKGKENANI